ncbi:replication fork protection component Swi3-domain-containing protein, partial [Dipodascopsis tothii]|uniref:replication fork protection component Swi3-domain-containing protein n=1 Tax=Dipodascopsis tothii TaxID=44089 RepID=UPI0034CE208F
METIRIGRPEPQATEQADVGVPAWPEHNFDAPADVDLGLDREIVVKTRRTFAKLDAERLTASDGLLELRQLVKSLRFAGKGHEYRDLARLVETYQLWGHRVFPKANFRDFLYMAERAGHSRMLRVKRQTWIDETRPRPAEPEPETDEAAMDAMAAVDAMDEPALAHDDDSDDEPVRRPRKRGPDPESSRSQNLFIQDDDEVADDYYDDLERLLRERDEEYLRERAANAPAEPAAKEPRLDEPNMAAPLQLTEDPAGPASPMSVDASGEPADMAPVMGPFESVSLVGADVASVAFVEGEHASASASPANASASASASASPARGSTTERPLPSFAPTAADDLDAGNDDDLY